MLIDSRRALLVSGSLLAGAIVVGLLVVLPATRPVVQEVDDAVWRFAGVVRNEPGTALSVALSWLGGAWVNWPLRAAALVLLAWRRHWLRLAAFALAVLSSEILIGTVKAGVGRSRPPGSLIETSGAAFPSAVKRRIFPRWVRRFCACSRASRPPISSGGLPPSPSDMRSVPSGSQSSREPKC